MPVDTKHPDYALMRPKWDRMRAVCAGQDAIHEGQEAYLPRLSGESDPDYKARIARSAFFEATWRTIEGLRGMLFRKPPVVVVSTAAEPMLEDVTKSGVDLETLAMGLTDEVLTLNRVGLMEDYPPMPKDAPQDRAMTVAEAERFNLRPNMAVYAAESIINWRYEWRGNRHMLVMVDLEETAQIPKENDRFSFTEEKRWRVLELDDNGEYCVTVYRKEGGQDVIVSGPDYPMRAGKRLRKIPFQIIDTSGKKGTVDLPPLLGLANLNISHYQTTADLEHGAHKTALPQPWIAGLTPRYDAAGKEMPVTLYMGGGSAWVLPPGAEAGMLQYDSGLDALEKRREAKERQMAIMGARMLEDQKAGVEAAETAGIHRSGEHSALAAIGSAISKGITEGLAEFDIWAGGAGEVEFKLNDEFFPASLSAQDVTALVGAWQAGGLSHQELFEKFQKGGVVRDGKEFEEHETEIANAPPVMVAAPLAVENVE